MKRKLSLILCLLLLIAAAGCGKTEPPANDTTPADTTANPQTETESAETEPAFPALPEKDMDGYDFRIDNYNEEWLSWAIHILTADETNGDALNDEVWARNNRVMERFNCKITAELERDPSAALAEKILSGENTYKLVMIYDEQLINHYAGGRLLTWDNIPHIDLTTDWWNENAGSTFIANGKPFAVTGDFSLSQSTRSFIMLFNKDMYADLGFADDLYTLVEDGKWTDDRLYEMEEAAVADLNGDGVIDLNDRFGCSTAVKLYFGSLVTGAGVKYIDQNENGETVFAIPGNEYALHVLSTILEKHNGSNMFMKVAKNIHDGSTDAQAIFKDNHSLFIGSSMKAVSNYRDMESDIGIIPFPKFDESQEKYYALTSGGTMASLPITLPAEEYENVGLILEAMSRDSHTGLVPLYKETLLKSRYARDEGSAKMLDIIFASASYDIGLSTFSVDTYYKYMEVYYKGTDTFVSLTEKIAPTVAKDLAILTAGNDGEGGGD